MSIQCAPPEELLPGTEGAAATWVGAVYGASVGGMGVGVSGTM